MSSSGGGSHTTSHCSGLTGTPRRSTMKPTRIGREPYNRPLERAGMTASRPTAAASAGRSAPIR
jgi:hypothetical protein